MSRCVVSPPAVCALTRRCAVASPGRRLRRKQFGVPKAEGTIFFAEAVLVRLPVTPVAAMSCRTQLSGGLLVMRSASASWGAVSTA